jgi:endonuclease III
LFESDPFFRAVLVMATPSRTAQIAKLRKVLRKHYSPIVSDGDRSVLEHLLFACCLENAHYPAAEESLAALAHNFFDWNEVRVSTVRELGEAMPSLPDPSAAAARVRRVLQSIFEATYSFDLEDVKKQNLKPAVEHLQKIDGMTHFCRDYVVHAALGGHAIPLDSGAFDVLRIVELVSAKEAAARVVPGLERAVAKNDGAEFASLLHQLGADLVANPYSHALHAILLEIDPTAKERLPNRRAAKKAETPGVPEKGRKTESKPAVKDAGRAKTAAKDTPKPSAKEPVKPAAAAAKTAPKEPIKGQVKEPSEPIKGFAKKKPGDELPAGKPVADTSPKPKAKAKDNLPPKEPASAKHVEPPRTKELPKKKSDSDKSKGGEGSAAEGLAKRKPR